MSVWGGLVLPRLIDLVMRNKAASAERARLVPVAAGVVLEVGIGSALNVPYYTSDVRALFGVDPSAALWRIGRRRIGAPSTPCSKMPASSRSRSTVAMEKAHGR